jgi:hypothetical protein
MRTINKIIIAILLIASFASCSNRQTSTKDDELLFTVKAGDKYGIIDKTGKYIANPQFDEIILLK